MKTSSRMIFTMLALVLLSTMYPEIVLSGQYYQYGDDQRQLAQEWQKAGWHYGYVYSWSSAGFRDPKEAMVWVQVTPSARDAAAFKRRGFTPEQAKWLMKKYPPQGYLTFGSFPKIDSYLHAGLTPRAVLSWIAVNITSSDPLIRRYVAMGMQDAELIEWEKQGIRVNEMVLFKNAGVSLSEAKEWQATGLNLNDMTGRDDPGADPRAAAGPAPPFRPGDHPGHPRPGRDRRGVRQRAGYVWRGDRRICPGR